MTKSNLCCMAWNIGLNVKSDKTEFLCILIKMMVAQSAGAVQFPDCSSAGGKTPSRSVLYVTKQSDGEAPVMLELWGMKSAPFVAITPRFTLARSGST